MKKGQGLSINTIILAVLALIVLVLLVLLIRAQLQKGSQKYISITETAETEARAKNICVTMFSLKSRVCKDACPKDFDDLGTGWADCKAPNVKCCQAR